MVADASPCPCVAGSLSTDEEQALEDAARLFRALGDRTRLAILRQLYAQDGICACDFQCCGLTQPTISHHLKVLRDAGLVSTKKCGLWVHYSLNVERLAILRAFPLPPRIGSEWGQGSSEHVRTEQSSN